MDEPETFYWLSLLAVGLMFGIGVGMLGLMERSKRRYLKRIRDSGIEEIDKMSGWEFEKFLEGLFVTRGFLVKHVGDKGRDYGADLVIEKDGVRTVVQAKRSKSLVGIKAIQEVVGAKRTYHCTRAMLVTNNYLTKAAWKLGRDNYVSMWTRKKLIEEILKSEK